MNTSNPGFRITDRKGFHMTFPNGYTVSVQFGPYNYCEHYVGWGKGMPNETKLRQDWESSDAECAVWGPEGDMLKLKGWSDTVKPSMRPEEVLKLLKWAAARPEKEKSKEKSNG